MRASGVISALGGLVAVAQATPHLLGDLTGLTSKASSVVPTTCSLAKSWEDHTLFLGIAAPKTETCAAISLGLHLPKAQISGDVELELLEGFLEAPKVRVGLGGVKAYVELDVSASAAVHESIELFASAALDLEIPGLEVEAGAAIALDLIVGVDAAIDLSTGVYISFGEEAYVEISLLTKDIVDVSLDGLVAKALPFGIGADVDLSAEVELEIGLRLRTEIDLEADIDIPVLDIEAGAKVAIWVSLFDYTAVLIATDDCVVSVSEVIALTLGLAVELNVEVGDILDLSLAPSLTITLATAAKAQVCLSSLGTPGVFLEGSEPDNTSTKTVSLVSATTAPSSGEDATSSPSSGESTTSAADPADPAVTTPAVFTTPGFSGGNSSAPAVTGDVTSTLTSTHVYTITSCAASVVNCPARYTQKVVTSTVLSTTYVCPATEAGSGATTTPASPVSATSAPVAVTTITESLTTIVPCSGSERTTSTFKAPSGVTPPPATITIVDTTTAYPVTTVQTAESTAVTAPASSGFVVVTTPASGNELPGASSAVTPGGPETPVPAPVETAPFPAGNGTVPTSKVVPGAPAATGSFSVPAAYTTPAAAVTTPGAATTPSSAPAPPASVVSGGNMVRGGLMMALPVVLALLI